jgi:hypothetical protein
MKILPVTFTAKSSKAMLSDLRSLLEGGYIMIHPKFEYSPNTASAPCSCPAGCSGTPEC